MARTINFDLRKVLHRTPHLISRWAVLYPLLGICRDDAAVTEATAKLQRRWRARVMSLMLDADYNPRPSQDRELAMFYARNCCPAFVYPIPKSDNCQWPICPFCYARTVVRIWSRLRRVIPRYDVADYPYSLVERHQVSTFPRSTDEAIVIGRSLDEAVAARSKFMKSRANRSLPGLIWYSLVDTHKNHYDVVTRQLFLLRAGEQMPRGFEMGKLRRYERPDGRKVMWIAVRLFRYPKSWMHGDLDCILAFLRARHRRKLMEFSGAFRPGMRPS